MRCAIYVTIFFLWMVLGAVGCGSNNSSCPDYAQKSCDKIQKCAPTLATLVIGDMDACLRQYRQQCERGIGLPGSAWTQERAAACAAQLGAANCDDLFTNSLPLDCRPAGMLADGAACGDDRQCQSQLCAIGSNRCGQCAPRGKAQMPCGSGCDFGLQCVQGSCVPYSKTGEACDRVKSCVPSLACLQGVCTAAQVGAACDASKDSCGQAAGLTCSAASNLCVQIQIKRVTSGEMCGVGSSEAVVVCGSGLQCLYMDMGNSACVAAAEVGAACDSHTGPACQSPAQCTAGVCTIFDAGTCK